jgi:transcriptional regulator with XRE-family HTH domain
MQENEGEIVVPETANGRLRQLRHHLKLSQVKFAQALHISNGYIAAIELGHCPLHQRIIALTVAAFGVDEHWLETGTGEMFPHPVPCQTPEQKLARMETLFADLYPEFQDYILNQIEQLVELQDVRH